MAKTDKNTKDYALRKIQAAMLKFVMKTTFIQIFISRRLIKIQ
jgi:hypothetical protein